MYDQPDVWRIPLEDCIEEMLAMDRGIARLVFADPPYNMGVEYDDDPTGDALPTEEYLEWCRAWMALCSRILTPDGSMWVLVHDEWTAEYRLILDGLGLHLRSWIKLHKQLGANCGRKPNRCSPHVFYYVKDPRDFVSINEAIWRPSDRQVLCNDRQSSPDGKIMDDAWDIKRLAGTHEERIKGFPTQLPLDLLRLIIGCASDPGDLVVDPFSGSGTTGHVAIELGRRYVGIERSWK